MSSFAWPLESNATVPKLVVPSQKVTEPLGVPEPGSATSTVAAKTTFCPATPKLLEAVRIILLFATPMVTACVLLVLAA